MSLPKETLERIEIDATKEYRVTMSHTHTDGPRTGYIKGATAEATRAAERENILVEALEKLANYIPNNMDPWPSRTAKEALEKLKALRDATGDRTSKEEVPEAIEFGNWLNNHDYQSTRHPNKMLSIHYHGAKPTLISKLYEEFKLFKQKQ